MKHARNLGRVLSLLLVLTMLAGVVASMAVTGSAAVALPSGATAWDGTTISTSLEGSGTEEDPYLIANAEDFVYFYNNTSEEDTSVYQLTGDVYFAKNNPKTAPSFGGTLDGNGHTIWNFERTAWGGTVVVFTKVSGAIKNITFEGLNLSSGENGDSALMMTLSGTLSNVHVKNATYKGGYVAGLSRNISGTTSTEITVENCSVQGTMKSVGGDAAYVGGVFARVDGPTAGLNILGCTIDVTVTSDGGAVRFGGLAAGVGAEHSANKVAKLTIADCVVRGSYKDTVGGASQYLGGLVGHVGQYCTTMAEINNCIVDMDIESANVESAGGLIGQSYRSIYLNNCMSSGDVTITAPVDNNYIGGVVGKMEQQNDCKIILNNYAQYGNVTGGKNAGGIVGIISMGYYSGKNNSPITLSGVILAGDVSGTAYVGGIAGYATSGSSTTSRYLDIELFSSAMTGTVSVEAGGRAGLFVGGSIDATPTNKITADGKSYVNESLTVFAPGNTTDGVVADKVSTDYSTYTPATYNASVLTDGTVLGVVNAYALANAKMPWVQGANGPELIVTALKLHGANLELTSNLTMNMRMDANIIPAGLACNIKLMAGDSVYEGVLDGNYYFFEVNDIDAADMGVERDYYLVVETTVGDVTNTFKALSGKSYSPVTYAKNIVAREDETAVKAQGVLDALVTYAYWAQNLEDGASTILDDYNAATGKSLSADSITYISLARGDVSAAALNSYVTVGANLNAGVNLVFKVKDDADVASLTLTAGGGTRTYYATEGHIEITGVHAGMLKNKLEITLNNAAGDAVASGTYSVANYLESVSKADLATYTWQEQFAARAAAMYMLAVGQYQTPAYYEVEGLESKTYSVADYQEVTNSYIFEENQFAEDQTTANLDGVEWTVDGANAYDYDADLGQAFGADESVVLSTDHYAQVNTVKVTASTAGVANFALRSVGATLEVYVGGTQIGETITLTDVATVYEFVVPTGVSGTLEIRAAATALFIKAIEVNGIKGEGAPAPEVHEHNYVVSSVTAPTCTEVGYTTYICDCGLTYTDDEVPALGHTWVDATLYAPKTCSVCGVTEGEALVAEAQIGETKYATLAEAVAQGGDILVLTDVVLDAPLVVTGEVTLNLNGKVISYTNTEMNVSMITNRGTLVINDTVGTGEIYYNYAGAADASHGKGNYTITNAGHLTLNGGKIHIAKLSVHAKYPINNNNGTGDAIFVMNGGHLYNYNTAAIRMFCNSTTYKNSVTINGGLVEGYSAIWMQNPGKNTVHGDLTITDGEIRTTAKAYVEGTATVKDVSSKLYCTIDGDGGAWSDSSFVKITGGIFNENVKLDANVPANVTIDEENATFNGNVYYYVAPTGNAKIGDNYYATLADALAAAVAGDTVELLADETYASILMIDKAITLEGNGKTLTSTAGRAINIETAETVTINNLTIACGNGCERGINIINVAGTTNLNNVTVENASQYAVQVATSAGAAIVNIDGCDLTGKNVVNVAGAGAVVTVANTNLVCDDQTEVEAYAALALYTTAKGATITATNCTFDIKGDSAKAYNGTADGSIIIAGSEDEVENAIAYIEYPGEVAYLFPTLQDAIDFAKDGETVVLVRDVVLTETVTISKNVTINLNDKTISGDFDSAYGIIYVKRGATLTISGEGTIHAQASTAIGNYGTVIVNGGNIISDAAPYCGAIYNFYYNESFYGTTVINGGSVDSILNCGNLTVNDGEVAYIDNSGKLVVVGGTVTEILAQDGSDAASVAGAGTIAIANTDVITLPDGYDLVELEAGVYQVLAHTHNYELTETVDATCTVDGSKTYTCACGDSYTETIEATGHDIVADKAVAPTCTATGLTAGEHCTKCDYKVAQDVVDALGHTEEIVAGKDATCTEAGLTEGKKCSVCGEVLVAQEEIAATGHTEEIVAGKDATCTETGLTEGKVCTVCGVTTVEQVVIPVSHNFVDGECACGMQEAVDTEATVSATISDVATDNGWENSKKYASFIVGNVEFVADGGQNTGKYYTNGYDWRIYQGESGTITITAGGAKIVSIKITYTSSNNGVLIYNGANATSGAVVAINATSATFSVGNTGSATNGQARITAIEVVYGETIPEHIHDENTFVGATCTTLGTCATCGKQGGELASHTWVDATCTAPKTCSVCGATEGEALGHTVVVDEAVAPTCTATGLTAGSHCSVCEEVLVAQEVVDMIDHNWVDPTCEEDGYCSGCQAEGDPATGVHNYVDGFCDMCGKEEPACQHENTTVLEAVAPTCTEDGLTEGTKCSACGEILVAQEVVDALGHTEVADEAVAPTCTATGLTAGSHCSVCNEVFVAQEEVATLPHTYVGANCQTEGVCSVCGAIGEKDATVHEDLTAATCTTAQTCVCGETVGEPAPHNYGDDGFCTYDCGAKQVLTEKTYDYTFDGKQWGANGDKTLNGIVWTLAGDGNYWGYDGTKGQQFGSGSAPYKNLTLTSSTLANVTKIVINTSTASSATATLKVYVGGTQIGTTKTLSSSATSYTFESATPLSGEVKLVYTQSTSKALYLKSINISYADVKVLEAHEHTFEGATCTTSGTCTYTENGLVCGKQGGEALGHTVVVDEAVAATCTTTGLTEGSHCSVCGEVLVAQQETDALGHDFENGENGMCANGCGTASCEHTEKVAIGEAKEPTCTEAGITAGEKCANCGQIFVEQEEIAATGHTEEIVAGKDATCAEAGLTEGKKCSVCDAVLVAQQTIPATGEHTFVDGTCSVCGYVKPSGPVLEITGEDFTTKSYADNNKSHTKNGYTYTSNQVYQNGGMQWKKNEGYITVASNSFTKLEIKVTAGTFTVTVGGKTVTGTTTNGVTTYDLTGLTGELKIKTGSSAVGKTEYIKFY